MLKNQKLFCSFVNPRQTLPTWIDVNFDVFWPRRVYGARVAACVVVRGVGDEEPRRDADEGRPTALRHAT